MAKQKTQLETGTPPAAVISAIRKILRSLVRLLLSFRITFPHLAELLKGVYVEIAEKEFRLPGKAQTDTRLNLLTGIHRKDIKRLRSEPSAEKETPSVIDIGGKLVARWLGESEYQDENGQPLALPLKTTDADPSFEALVQEVCKQDIRPRVVLDEWLNLGIVSLDEDKKLHLDSQAFIPRKGLEEKAYFLGHNVSDHLAAATHNILEHQPAFFERCVYYEGLSDESIQQLRELAASKGMETLVAINELALELKKQDNAETTAQHNQRIDIGLYIFHESEEQAHE